MHTHGEILALQEGMKQDGSLCQEYRLPWDIDNDMNMRWSESNAATDGSVQRFSLYMPSLDNPLYDNLEIMKCRNT